MWSGPRNLSSAMMYAFAQREDCAVIDEPFYGVYLERTGLDHPMREEVLAAMPGDADAIAEGLVTEAPALIYYQKHMCQHMIPGLPRDWMREVTNVFLIRHPARVVASFSEKISSLTQQDIGFELQAELYDEFWNRGEAPIVIDSADIRQDPEGMLGKLCDAIGIDFDPAMLSWPAGGHPADGVWAAVWYGSLHKSTGFAGAEGPLPELGAEKAALAEAAFPLYQRLKEAALTL